MRGLYDDNAVQSIRIGRETKCVIESKFHDTEPDPETPIDFQRQNSTSHRLLNKLSPECGRCELVDRDPEVVFSAVGFNRDHTQALLTRGGMELILRLNSEKRWELAD